MPAGIPHVQACRTGDDSIQVLRSRRLLRNAMLSQIHGTVIAASP